MISKRLLILLPLTLALTSACSWFGGGDREEESEYITAAEVYENAHKSLASGNYSNAIRIYKLLISKFPFGRYTEQSQLELSYAYFKSFRHEEAIASLNRFIKTHPTHKHIDYAHYLRGLVSFTRDRGILERLLPQGTTDRDQASARQAFQDFAELVNKYPDSRYVDDARQRMIWLKDNLAAYEMHVARYYFRRQAWIAAANRSKHVVETYQTTEQTADALAIMAESYEKLGLMELSQDAERVLQMNYPGHPYFSGEREDEEGFLGKLWPF